MITIVPLHVGTSNTLRWQSWIVVIKRFTSKQRGGDEVGETVLSLKFTVSILTTNRQWVIFSQNHRIVQKHGLFISYVLKSYLSSRGHCMSKSLTFLHTSPVHVATFDRLLLELDPRIPVRHLVEETLLEDARSAGAITPQLAQRVHKTVMNAFAADAAVVVCTCSTLGGCAEQTSDNRDRTVMRIDRPMAERAVTLGKRIVVVAALATTLEPTRQLLLTVAEAQGKQIDVIDVVSPTAWAAFEAGNTTQYLHDIAATLRQAASSGDVIVLAQASMAGAIELCQDVTIPILTSPRIGAEAAVKAYYEAHGTGLSGSK
jgi:hypothetical protein